MSAVISIPSRNFLDLSAPPSAGVLGAALAIRAVHREAAMTHVMKRRGCDPGRNRGMPERAIVSYHENNHGRAVKRLDVIDEQFAGFDFASAPGLLADQLKREQLISTNSMILHEASSLASLGDESEPGASLKEAPASDSACTTGGVPHSPQWARRSAAAAAGCCSSGRQVSANSPISRIATFNRPAVQK